MPGIIDTWHTYFIYTTYHTT